MSRLGIRGGVVNHEAKRAPAAPAIDQLAIRSKNWCGTLFRDGKTGPELLELWRTWDREGVQYEAYQLEKCPETERLHIQWCIMFKSAKRGSTVKALVTQRAYIQAQNGTVFHNRAYATKADTRIEGPFISGEWIWGDDPAAVGKGKRTDLRCVYEDIKQGRIQDYWQVCESSPQVAAKHTQWVNALLEHFQGREEPAYPIKLTFKTGDEILLSDPNPEFKVAERPTPEESMEWEGAVVKKRHWIVVGPANCGKSTAWKVALNPKIAFVVGKETKGQRGAWDNYIGQDIIIYDDVMPQRTDLLAIVEASCKFPMPIPGGTRYTTKTFPKGRVRTALVFLNTYPLYWNDQPFCERFNKLDLWEPDDPNRPPIPGALPVGRVVEPGIIEPIPLRRMDADYY